MLRVEKTAAVVLIRCEGLPLLQYRVDGRASKPYFDLVALPPSARRPGENITLARPHDHVWHFGLFFAQKFVDDVNFWESELLASKGEPYGRFEPRGDVTTRVLPDGSVSCAHALNWNTNKGETLVTEQREIRVCPPSGDSYRMDWTLRLTAVGKDRGIRSLCQYGDYSGLSYRSLRSMDHGTVLDSEGRTEAKQIMGQPARWLDYSGKLDGCMDMNDPDWAGIAMFDHPGNPGYPVRWFCMNEPFGFLAANRTYGQPQTLTAGKKVTWRYGVCIHAGRGDKRVVERAYDAFAGTA